MYAFSSMGRSGGRTPAQRQGRRARFACPRLEALEDRYTPAVVSSLAPSMAPALVQNSTPAVTPAPTLTPAASVAGSGSPSGTIPTPTSFQQIGSAVSVALLALPGATSSLASSRILSPAGASPFAPTLQGQGPAQIPSFAIPTGFPGRLIFPTTGVNVRTPNGDGPMQAPAGVFLAGGGDQAQQAVQNPPVLRPPSPLPGSISVDLDGLDLPTDTVLDQGVPDSSSVDPDDLDILLEPYLDQ